MIQITPLGEASHCYSQLQTVKRVVDIRGKRDMIRKTAILDGNEAAASVAYRLNEVIAIYPITPASPMGEWADQWKEEGRKNIWGAVPTVIEMQSEGGAAGTLHGALQAGALGTTFTASQGLLLMIPNMYKIAGELTPTVIHVAARLGGHPRPFDFWRPQRRHGCARHGLRAAVLEFRAGSRRFRADCASGALESRIPFLHFFDGFRTSHEVNKILLLEDDDLRGADRRRRWSASIGSGHCRPITLCCAERRKIPTYFFRRARRSIRSTGRVRPLCRTSWIALRSAPAGTITCSIMSAPPMPSG